MWWFNHDAKTYILTPKSWFYIVFKRNYTCIKNFMTLVTAILNLMTFPKEFSLGLLICCFGYITEMHCGKKLFCNLFHSSHLFSLKRLDYCFLKKWRPLSLLNSDYKILAQIYAMRLQKVLPSITSELQNGYI